MNKEESYRSLLKDPRWIKKRNKILLRDKNTCQFCGCQDKYMQVHHEYYIEGRNPWEYEDEALVTICSHCHEKVTEESSTLYPLFLQVRNLFREHGFSDFVLNDILCRFSSYLEFWGDKKGVDDKDVLNFISKAVCETQNYKDFKALKKFGIKYPQFIKNQFPMFFKDYLGSSYETE